MRALYSGGVLIFVLTNLLVPMGSGPAHRVAWGQQGQPFSAAQIEDLIKNNVSSARLTSLVAERGINFEITAAIKTKLQNAGAENSIIAALEKASAKYVIRREEAKRKEEEKRIAEERRRKLEEELRIAEEKRRIEEVRRQQEEEFKRAEIEKHEREAALARRKSEQEAIRKEAERKKEEETRKRNQELASRKELERARKTEVESKNPTASAPPCSVGLQHVFQYEDGTRFTRRIGRREGELCVIGQSYYDKDWTLVKQIGRNGQEITSSQPDYPLVGEKWLPFPLAIGKEWQINYRSRFGSRAGVGYFINYFKVLSFDKIAIPAGNFAAFKIRQEQRHGSGALGVRYFWYAPDVEYYVKHEVARDESSDANYWSNVKNYQLVAVTRPKK